MFFLVKSLFGNFFKTILNLRGKTMKLNAKLLVIALILALFSIGAVASAENVSLESSDINSVSDETFSISSTQDIETTNIESSASDYNQVNSEITRGQNIVDDYKSSSDDVKLNETIEAKNSLLGASNDDVLSETIYPSGTSFQAIRMAIDKAKAGDVIDLGGNTYTGTSPNFVYNKKITMINGVLNGGNVGDANFQLTGITLINISFINFDNINPSVNDGDCFKFYNSTLINCSFDNCIGYYHIMRFISSPNWNKNGGGLISYCNFTNSHVLYDGRDKDDGQFIHLWGNATVDHCNFINTSSNHHAGAICMDPVGAIVTNSYFENCKAWIGGAIYVHGHMNRDIIDSILENCTFKNCLATEDGGAIATNYGGLNITNCLFINNSAQKGGAIMVGGIDYPQALRGDNLHGHNIKISNCEFMDNVANEGGAVHISGDNDTIVNCKFDDNFALHGKGAAVYVEGENASVYNSHFTNHESEVGTVYIEGNHAKVVSSGFENNHAFHGGAGVYIEGDDSYIFDSQFRNNNASRHGGAIHTIGDRARILNSSFYYNNAIPSSQDSDYGLGGAIYIDGRENEISFSKFKYNTARNGSAVYNRGEDLILNDDSFENNQAWSYFLFTDAKPPEAHWEEDMEFLVNVTLVAGDNLINAIYNDRSIYDIYFHNVTYTLKPTDLYPTGIRTTTPDEIHPVDGVENSHGGKYLYQDAREDDQVVNINITFKDGQVFEYSGKTNMYGSVAFPITKENMTDGQFHPGVYTINAEHPDDEIYTAIQNSTTFTVLPHVDISVTKTSNKDIYFVGEKAIFTIIVSGIGTNATNVVVDDILPQSFRYVSSSATQGGYDSKTNRWSVGFLPHLASQTLTLTVQTTELGTFDNVVIANCTERDWNLSNNRANKTIHVDLYYTKEVNVTKTSAGEYIEYYLRVFNTGSEDYTEPVLVRDLMPEGIKYENYELVGADLIRFTNYAVEQVWEITNISAGYSAQITVKAKALKDGIWNNSMMVWDYPSVNATVNVSSMADLQIIKDVQPSTVNNGDTVTWTIVVINHGPSKAFGVYVEDILPAGLQIVNEAYPDEGTTFNRYSGIWYIGEMNLEEKKRLVIETRVTVSGDNITNVAVVNATTPDPDPTNNEDNATIEFNPDVIIEKTVSTQNTYHGAVITWTINVTNNGPHTANDVYVIDKLPSGLRYINYTINKGRQYNPGNGRWTIGSLEEGESAILTITTEVTIYDGFITNNATVYSSNDNNPDNNYDEDFTQVRTEADVSIVKLVSKQTSRHGDEIEWTIIVTNNGPNTAEGVYVIDFLPSQLVQTKEPYKTKGQISHLGKNGLWTIGNLANGENATLIVYTKVNTTDDTVINVVNVTSTTHDPDLSNNWAENATYVPPECDVQVIKNVNNFTPNKGDNVIWTISVVNVGPNVAENVNVNDVLPSGLQYVSHKPVSQGTFDHTKGVWTIGTLEVNSRLTLEITTKVVDTGKITNEVNVTTSTYDTNLNNNYANETIDVPAIADLEIIKLVSNKNPKYGDLINWTIIVKNKGPNNARNVIINDKLPSGLIYVTHNPNATGLYDPAQGIWQVGDLLNSQSKSLVITTRVNITNATITNIAVVTSDTPDNNTENNEANNTTTIDPVADLEIVKTVDNHSPKKGENVTWTVVVTNKGPDTAIDAIASEILPEGLILIRAYPTGQSSYDHRTNLWYLQDMTKGQSISMTLVTQVNVTKKVLTNIIVVTSETPDPDLSNNVANATIDVGHDADLGIIKTVSNSTPKKGDNIIWHITVKNNGPDDAIDVYVNDTLPKGLVWISDNGNGTYNHNTGIWNIGTLTNQSSLTLTITTKVNATGNITNVAVVDSDTNDPYPENNTDNDTIHVKPEADLELFKYTLLHETSFGDEITWIIYVYNHGPDTAVDAYVVDKLPAGLIYKDDNSNGKYNKTSGIWTIGNLTKGQPAYLEIYAIVNITNGTITNYAVVNSSTYDPNPDNNEDDDTTVVKSIADLAVIKKVSDKNPHFGKVITWTVVVKNKGPCDAHNVTVTDKLPEGLIYQSDDSKGAYNKTTGIWTIGELTNGSTVELNIKTLVNITNATITNVAVVNSTTPDTNESNNKGENTTDVDPEADLEIIKLVSNKTAYKGDVITWTIIVTNHGPDTALDVYVVDDLPAGLVVTGYSKTNGIFDSDSGIWYIKSLAKGESENLTLTTLVNVSSKNLTNIVNVTNEVYDPNKTNNEANNTTEVYPSADLQVIKTAMNSTYNKGDIVVWNITIINHGPDAAVDVVLFDLAEEGLIFINKTYSIVETRQLIVERFGTLDVGDSITIFVKTLVNKTNVTLENQAFVTSLDTHDPNPDNNHDNDIIKANPQANLVVEKFVSSNEVKTGEEVIWTIVVTNNGPDVSVNTRVTDKLPAGLIYNGHKSEGNYDPETGVWIVGDLAKGDSKVLEIRTIVNVTKTLVNVANVTGDTPGNRTNGTNKTTGIGDIADVEVIKLVSNATPKKGDVVFWTIVVTNHGPDVAKNVNVTDKLPAGLIYNGHDGPGFYDSSKGIWLIGDMAKDDTAKLIIRTIVDISNGTIENIAVVNSSTQDNNTDNNKANNTTTVNDDADLVIVKVVSNKNPKLGEEITWTITVTNKGPSDAKNVRVTDKLPAGLIFNGANGNYNKDTGLWIVGDIANGKSASLVIKSIVNITNTTITNIANVISDTPDSNKTNNEANNTTYVDPVADLKIIKIVSNSTPNAGDIITWTLIVTNIGPDSAINVKIFDEIPQGLSVVVDGRVINTRTISITIPEIKAGQTVEQSFDTLVDITNANITNFANVTSDTYDPNKTNNEDRETVDVPPEADLEIVKLVSDKTTGKGEIITWTVVVTNKGPDAASNVYVKDTLPAGLVYNEHTTTKGLFDHNSLTWYINELGNGESATLTIKTLVNVNETTLVNNVNVTNDVYDPNETNNNANNTTTVEKELPADLEVIKVVSDSNPRKGDTITWTITVTNNGPGNAHGVTVTDKLPAGLIFIKSDGNYNRDTGVWTIGDLENGKSVSLVISTKVDITNAKVTNVAVVNSTTPDDNPDNNKDNETSEIDPEADVKVIKTVSNPKPAKGDTITWTITVINLGPDAAEDVIVEDNLPEGLILLSARGSKGAFDDGIWTVGTLNYGESATLVLTTKVTATGTIRNIAVATTSTYDPNITNNKDYDVTRPKDKPVTPSADLEVIKEANVNKVKVGDKIIWTITVTNYGPDTAKNVRVTDVLYGDAEYLSSKASKGTFDPLEGVWTIGDMNPGDSVVLTIECKALVEGIVINTAEVVSDTPDPNKDNNRDISVVTVEDRNDTTPDYPTPDNQEGPETPATMHATGNPLAMVLLALLSLVGVTLRRKID